MVPLVTRSNRVDERGRGVKDCGERKPQSGTAPRCWKSCLRDNKRNPTKYISNDNCTENNWALGIQTVAPNWSGLHPSRYAVFLIMISYLSTNVNGYPHQPFKWTLSRFEDQTIIATQITSGEPSFNSSLCQLVPRTRCWEYMGFYMCPSSNPGKGYCNSPNQYYCSYWGCETIAPSWIPGCGRDKYLRVQWGPYGCTPPKGWKGRGNCKYLFLNITQPTDIGWTIGRIWGVRYTEPGTDKGGLILIKKEPIPQAPSGVGPNSIIIADGETDLTEITPSTKITPSVSENNTNINLPEPGTPTPTPQTNPLWNLLQASFQVLNTTNPNITKHCWLCYDIRPPYYEAIGVDHRHRKANGTNPAECLWDTRKQGITVSQVTGKGRCLGTVPRSKQHLCNKTVQGPSGRQADWLLPAENAKWVCSQTGVTPCLSTKVFDWTKEFCIQVIVVPRVIYHPESFMYNSQASSLHHIQKREPFTALTVAILMVTGAAGAGTGIASLVQQNQGFQSLRIAVDEDLARIEKAMTALEQSVRSLSEVVLQNRRGLDLMFLQQGGLCAALQEECCVYADHTGVVRDTMTKLREGLEKRRKERESQQSWYESWFNHSPWLTTLVSTIAGPVILLILGLTFGPCIFNKIIGIVKGRLEAAHLMMMKTKYELVNPEAVLEETLALSYAELQRFDEQNNKKEKGGL